LTVVSSKCCRQTGDMQSQSSFSELEQNLGVLELPPMSQQERGRWQRFGDLVHGAGKGAFETNWP